MDKSSAQNTHAGFGDRFIAFANKVSDVSGLVAAYLLVPLVIVFLIEIVSRNVFNHPTTWASGTCFLIGGCAAVLGFGYAMKSGAMVRIDALSSKLPEKAHCILDLILYAVLFLPLTIGGSYECIKNAVVSVSKFAEHRLVERTHLADQDRHVHQPHHSHAAGAGGDHSAGAASACSEAGG